MANYFATKPRPKAGNYFADKWKAVEPEKPNLPEINETPYNVDPIYGDSGLVLNSDEVQAGLKGRATAHKLPPSLSASELAKISTSAGPQYTAQYVGPKIKQDLAPDESWSWQDMVKVEGDDVYYLDAKSKKNPGGSGRWIKIPSFPVAQAGKMALEVGGYAAGSHPALAAAKIPRMVGAAAGTAGAGGAAEVARLKLGRKFGINDALPGGAEWKAGAKEGALTGAMSLGGDMLMQNMMKRWGPRGDYFFNPQSEDNIFTGGTGNQVYGDDAVSRVNQIHQDAIASGKGAGTATEIYDPSIARRSADKGNKELLDLEATLMQRGATSRSAETADKLRAREVSSTRVLDQVLDYMLPSSPSKEFAGDPVKAAIAESVDDPAYAAAKNRYLAAKGDMSTTLRDLSGGKLNDEQVMAILRGSADDKIGLEGKLTELKGVKDAAWIEADNLIYDLKMPDGVAESSIKVPMQDIRNKLETDMLTLQYQGKIYGTPLPDKVYEPLLRALDDGGTGSLDLGQMIPAIRDLKSTYRASVGNRDLTGYEEKIILDVQQKLENHMIEYLGKGQHADIQAAYLKAKDVTKVYEDFAQRSVARDLLARYGGIGSKGGYTETGTSGLRKVFQPRTTEHARVIADATKADVEAQQVLKDYLFNDYVSTATKNGIVNPEAHAKWMADHGDQLSMFMDEKQFSRMQYLGEYGKVYKEHLALHKETIKLWQKGWGGKVGRMAPEDIGKAMLSGRLSAEEIRGMVGFLGRKSPEALASAREIVQAELRTKVFKGTQKAGISDEVSRMLEEGSGGVEKLSAIFGQQYVNDLKLTYRELLKWQSPKYQGSSFGLPANSIPMTFARVVFGPLSKAQRFITAGKQWELQGYEKQFLEVLTNPEKLRKLIRYKDMAFGEQNAGIMAVLGYEFFTGNPALEIPK